MRLKSTRLRIAERVLAGLMGSPKTNVNGSPFDTDKADHMRELAVASINAAEYLMAANRQLGWREFIWNPIGVLKRELRDLQARVKNHNPQAYRQTVTENRNPLISVGDVKAFDESVKRRSVQARPSQEPQSPKPQTHPAPGTSST